MQATITKGPMQALKLTDKEEVVLTYFIQATK
jgi:hypothetical protein